MGIGGIPGSSSTVKDPVTGKRVSLSRSRYRGDSEAAIRARAQACDWMTTELNNALQSLTALSKARRAHKDLFGKPAKKRKPEPPRPAKGDYRVEWIETGKNSGHYVAEVKTPDGEWRRYEMKDPAKLIHYYNEKDDYGSAMDAAYEQACYVLADFAVDSELAQYASEQKMKKGRPTKVKRVWLANKDGSGGGEWAAKLAFSNNTSFLMPLHRKRKPLFPTKKLDKAQREALARELFETAQTEYEH